jgi:2-haloacid dehalogenase
MSVTLAVDVYGTLIDTSGVTTALRSHLGEQAPEFARVWREKQLEYAFRRGLMQNYCEFAVCIRHALEYTCRFFRSDLSETDKEALLAAYRSLPAYPDVDAALQDCQAHGFRLFAFSNGRGDVVADLLGNAKLDAYFADIISVDEIKSFKPNPAVYSHFLRRSGSVGGEAWLISGNPFDVIGAGSFGMYSAWVRRSPEAIFDPWEIQPTITVASMAELREAISGFDR